MFAIEYGTITVFTHRLRDRTLSFLKKDVLEWLLPLEKVIKEALDSEYYLFSNLEYNALRSFLHLRETMEAIVAIPPASSHEAREISGPMDSFTSAYAAIKTNHETIEYAFRKLSGRIKGEHGLMGFLKNILDEPLYNNRPLCISSSERMGRTIQGVLFSYYSVRKRVLVKTLNQVMYVTGCDGKIESDRKILTPGAVASEKHNREKKNSEKKIMVDSFRGLERIMDYFLPMGKDVEAVLLKMETGSKYGKILEEHESNPLVRIKRLVEIFIKYFIEDMKLEDEFTLSYDGREFGNYFTIRPEIRDMAAAYNLVDFGLVASRLREFLSLAGKYPQDLMDSMLEGERSAPAISPELNSGRSVLMKISEKSYAIANRLAELISYYYNHREIVHQDVLHNYDFFTNARLKRSRHVKSPAAFKRSYITLREFLETSCAIAFHISDLLRHPGIGALRGEQRVVKDKLSLLMGEDEIVVEPLQDQGDSDPENNERIVQELDRMYVDTLTGLKRRQYYEEIILKQQHSDSGKYEGLKSRFLFMCEIFGLKELNERFGHTAGDEIVLAAVSRIDEHVRFPGSHGSNSVIRYAGGVYLGFLHDLNMMEAVDRMREMVRSISMIIIERDGAVIGQIRTAAAIYEERRGSDHYLNMDVLKGMVSHIYRNGSGRVGFIKKPDYIVSRRDFDSRDNLNDDIIALTE
jgi:diguanylate cyclase (GGDEF)-like protein